jgi:hypothetical protein
VTATVNFIIRIVPVARVIRLGSYSVPEWALRDSNPQPAEYKCDPFCREVSSMVTFVDIDWIMCRPLSVLSCAIG